MKLTPRQQEDLVFLLLGSGALLLLAAVVYAIVHGGR